MYIPKEYNFYIKQNAYIDGKAAAKIFRFAINFKNSKIVQNCKKPRTHAMFGCLSSKY